MNTILHINSKPTPDFSLSGSSKPANLIRSFYITFFITLIIKVIVAITLPFTADEAYYMMWGKFLAAGYYDHTPMIGWVLHVFLYFGKSQLAMRLPTIITSSAIGLILYALMRKQDAEKAALIAILYLISPINLLGMLITTDIPLIFFSFLSGISLFLAIRHKDHLGYYLLAGIFLGCAFFSKYFAVLLAAAYFLYFLFSAKSWKRTLGFLLVYLCVLPFGLQNLYWNYTHAWANIAFNVINRNTGIHLGWHSVLLYLAILIYDITPPILFYLLTQPKKLFTNYSQKEFNLLSFLIIFPLGFFFVLSFFKDIGLHWPLSFMPFIYLGLFCYFTHAQILKCVKFMIGFTLLHIILLVILLTLPLITWQKLGLQDTRYANIVFLVKHKQIRDALNPYNKNFIFASPTYAKADMFYYDSGYYAPTFGIGSVHGRQGDFDTDFKPMAHKNFLIFDSKPDSIAKDSIYFAHSEMKTLQIDGSTFYYLLGYDFNYPKYRDTVLRTINDRYWQTPNYLPHTPSFYCEKYFAQEGCPDNSLK